ncbi:MAG: hypothetical protein HOB19_02225 [Elusimicrobiaceae bacterium]|jgi:hypothetical protein|nr:hypothetical protein [Elusimicrobiaceae bacterium]
MNMNKFIVGLLLLTSMPALSSSKTYKMVCGLGEKVEEVHLNLPDKITSLKEANETKPELALVVSSVHTRGDYNCSVTFSSQEPTTILTASNVEYHADYTQRVAFKSEIFLSKTPDGCKKADILKELADFGDKRALSIVVSNIVEEEVEVVLSGNLRPLYIRELADKNTSKTCVILKD